MESIDLIPKKTGLFKIISSLLAVLAILLFFLGMAIAAFPHLNEIDIESSLKISAVIITLGFLAFKNFKDLKKKLIYRSFQVAKLEIDRFKMKRGDRNQVRILLIAKRLIQLKNIQLDLICFSKKEENLSSISFAENSTLYQGTPQKFQWDFQIPLAAYPASDLELENMAWSLEVSVEGLSPRFKWEESIGLTVVGDKN